MKSIEVSKEDYMYPAYEFEGNEDGLDILEDIANEFFDSAAERIIKWNCIGSIRLNEESDQYDINVAYVIAPIDIATAMFLNIPDEIKEEITTKFENVFLSRKQNENLRDHLLWNEDDMPILNFCVAAEAIMPSQEDDYYWLGDTEVRAWWEYNEKYYLVYRKEINIFENMRFNNRGDMCGKRKNIENIIREFTNMIAFKKPEIREMCQNHDSRCLLAKTPAKARHK